MSETNPYRTENYQPLFDYSYNSEMNISRYNILGPLITIKSQPQIEERIFRPFYSSIDDKKTDTKNIDFLYPLGNYKKTPEWQTSRFTPLYTSQKDLREEGKVKRYSDFFPIFWGVTEEGEKYGGLFPVYGNFKKRFGRDEIKFFIWPVYLNIKDDKTNTTDFIWPIFSMTTGEKESGFRMWPLFGYRAKEAEYSRLFLLWPFIHYQNTGLDTTRPKKYRAFLPFYASETSPGRVTRSVIWPFFNYLYDEDEKLTLWDFPWPIIHRGSGENLKSFSIFPIFGYKSRKDMKEHYFLWPIYTYKREYPEEEEKTIYRFLLVSKYEFEMPINKTQNSELRTQNYLQLRFWPLFNYKKGKGTETTFYFPEILPIETEGFDRNYSPLFRLYEYYSSPEGEIESKLFWGLYSHKKNSFGEFIDLSFILSYEKREDERSFSILKGLLELGKKNGKNYFKILYIPLSK